MGSWPRLRKKSQSYCDQVCDSLERTVTPEDRDEVAALGTVLSQLPEDMRKHVYSCETCRIFADDLLQVRGVFAGREAKAAQPGPFLLARVMATIADRESQLALATQTWAAVPRLASRLTVLASLGLLVAASWVYQMPKTTTTAGISSPQASEGLVDVGATQDDLLVSPAGR
jgi:hypothetical protein